MSLDFLITALVVVLIPGTGVIYTVALGLGQGRLASIAAALGCTLGILPHILASVLGVAAVLHTSALLFQLFKYAGAAYLLYLAWMTLKSKGPLQLQAEPTRRPLGKIVRTGFAINILNPKLSVFFLAFLPQFVSGGSTEVALKMLGLGGVFMVMTFVVFVFYGVFAAWAGAMVLSSAEIMNWIRRVMALAFGTFGLRLAFGND